VTKSIVCLAVALAVVAIADAVLAQAFPRPDMVACPRDIGESDDRWAARCWAAEQAKAAEAGRRAAVNALEQRAALEKRPALPATHNPLLGWWRPAVVATLNACGFLLTKGFVEFEQSRMGIVDGDGRTDLGAVEYRGGPDGSVFVLPTQGVALLSAEFDAPDRVSLVMYDATCAMVRTAAPP
jgi:hypothetical protein